MGLPPRIPGSRPRHPFGRLAFATGIAIVVVGLVLGVLLLRSDDQDSRNAGLAMLTVVGVCMATVGVLTLLERVMARRDDR